MVEDRLLEWLKTAIAFGATDIHYHHQNMKNSLQMRTINGLKNVSSDAQDLLVYQYLKYVSNLDLSQIMEPQTGTFEYVVGQKVWYCRFSMMETFSAKSGVLRILNLSPISSLKEVSVQTEEIEIIETLYTRTHGLLLFSGSTGSGKSTTMFSGLKSILNRSIVTLEDPIERMYESILQMEINHHTGFDFQKGIKHLLRHDPDIVVIGEIRSPEEARAALRASFSGHLVVSTIHASGKSQTLYRLLDLELSKSELELVPIDIVYQQLIVENNQRRAHLEILRDFEVKDILQTIA